MNQSSNFIIILITCIILYRISQLGDSLIGVNLSLIYFLLETGDEKEDLEFGLCLGERKKRLIKAYLNLIIFVLATTYVI